MKFQRGFTLIELLVVIAIISLLSSVVLASVRDARDRAAHTRFDSDFLQLRTAIELYRSDNNGAYPPSIMAFGGVPDLITQLNNAGYFPSNSIILPQGYSLGSAYAANASLDTLSYGVVTCGNPDESGGNYSIYFQTDGLTAPTSRLPALFYMGASADFGETVYYCIEI